MLFIYIHRVKTKLKLKLKSLVKNWDAEGEKGEIYERK